MTMPRKFESAVDAQIRAAEERGEFDNLPGKGKPIPGAGEPDDDLWWVRGFVKREGLPAEAMLPTWLRLRKEVEILPERVRGLRSERAVRDLVEDLNQQIGRELLIPTGPKAPPRAVDVAEMVELWRAARAARPEPEPAAPPVAGAGRRRWFRRRSA